MGIVNQVVREAKQSQMDDAEKEKMQLLDALRADDAMPVQMDDVSE